MTDMNGDAWVSSTHRPMGFPEFVIVIASIMALNPLAMDIFNEEICTLLKKKIKDSIVSVDDLSIRFSYLGEVSLQDSEEILEKITTVQLAVDYAVKNQKA